MNLIKNKILIFLRKINLLPFILCLGVLFLFALLLSPTLSIKYGNVFFGKVPTLYNVRIAQVFFVNAAYPLFNNTPAPFAHYQLSRVNFITGNLNQALYEIQEEIKLYPNEKRSYYILGLTLGYLHKEKEAIEAFSTFIENYPDSWAARNDKAWLQFRIGDIDGALETISPVVEAYTKNVWIQNTYCTLLINKKDYSRAEKACTYAKEGVETMSEKDWGRAYPGNDPRIYDVGLSAMKKSIESNLKLIDLLKNAH